MEMPRAGHVALALGVWGRRETNRVLDPRQVRIRLLEPVIEVLSIVGGVALAIGGHAEHDQGILDLC